MAAVLLQCLPALAVAMEFFAQDSQVQRWAMEALDALIQGGQEAAAEVATAENDGAVLHTLIASLRSHPESSEVQRWGLTALQALCEHGGSETSALLASLGAAELALAAMGAFPASTGIQTSGLAVLALLALDESTAVLTNEMALSAVRSVVAAMMEHKEASAIQRWGAAALWALSERGCEPAVEEAIKEGAPSILVHAVQAWLTDADVVRWCASALHSIVMRQDTAEALSLVTSCNMVEVLVQAMETHRGQGNTETQVRCVATLAAIAIKGLVLDQQVGNMGQTLDAVNEVVQANPGNEELLQWAQALSDALAGRRSRELHSAVVEEPNEEAEAGPGTAAAGFEGSPETEIEL